MPLTLKLINARFAKHGHNCRLARGDGYFYFRNGEAAESQMSPGPVVIPEIGGQCLLQVSRVKYQEMVQAFAPYRSDQPLRVSASAALRSHAVYTKP